MCMMCACACVTYVHVLMGSVGSCMSVSYMCDFGWCDVHCVADMWWHVRISSCVCVCVVCVWLASPWGWLVAVADAPLVLVWRFWLVHGYAYAWPAMVLTACKFVFSLPYWRLMGCW